jgi:hypothetical protein
MQMISQVAKALLILEIIMFQSISDSAFFFYNKAEKTYNDLKDKFNQGKTFN